MPGERPEPRTPALEARGVTKVFPPATVALDDVSLAVEAGEIHAVVGENGAGKSTLMRILAGELAADRGQVLVGDRPVRFTSARDAMAAGIGLVHQEILLVEGFTVWENVVLGAEPVRRVGLIDAERARADVAATLDRAGFPLRPDALVGELSVAARQQVEIAKLLHRDVGVLILDEPTAVLTPQEVPRLFAELRRLRDGGRTVVFISHRLGEVLELADRVSVLRDGHLVGTVPAAGTTRSELARLMVDRDVVLTSRREPRPPGPLVLEVAGLRSGRLGPVDLTVHAGEIVGVAGLDDAGQRELVDAVVGVAPVAGGTIRVLGVDVADQPIVERRLVLAAVPADRRAEGGAVSGPVLDTARMTHHRRSPRLRSRRGWWQRRGAAAAFARELQQRYEIVMSGPEQLFGSLSGGNQQKVVVGRELAFGRPLLVLDQPTRGIDVGSVEALHGEILRRRADGTAVLLVSADLEELLLLSDRIHVLHRGRTALEGPVGDLTAAAIGEAMLNGPAGEPGPSVGEPDPSVGER
jgi:ABC-type uncharacterized transport system ATPase subunit